MIRRYQVRDQARRAALVFSVGDRRGAHSGMTLEHGLDLAGLDAEAADLQLTVAAADEFDRAVGQPSRAIAGAVDTCARLFAKGVWGEPFGRELGAIQVSAAHADAADAKLARDPDRLWLEVAVKDVDTRVRKRLTDWDEPSGGSSASEEGSKYVLSIVASVRP